MATLADSFLADLDELSDKEADIVEEDNGGVERMEDDVDEGLADIEKLNYEPFKKRKLNYDDLDNVSKLQKSQRYKDVMQKVEIALEKGLDNDNHGIVCEDDPEYQLIADCNALSVDIEKEIGIVHSFIRDKYRLKFPELESLVQRPIDYALLVKRIGNEMDLTLVDLKGLLPPSATSSGKQLPEEELHKAMEACDRVLALDSDKKKVVDFVESKIGDIAPNLSALVGSGVAAKLMCTAGGLSSLANMRACNVELLGAKEEKNPLAGFSSSEISQFRVDYLEQSEIFQTTPPSLRMRACGLLARMCISAARVDSTRGVPLGHFGKFLGKELRKKIMKWQEPPPLPVPDSEPKEGGGGGGGRMLTMTERQDIAEMQEMFCRRPPRFTGKMSLARRFRLDRSRNLQNSS